MVRLDVGHLAPQNPVLNQQNLCFMGVCWKLSLGPHPDPLNQNLLFSNMPGDLGHTEEGKAVPGVGCQEPPPGPPHAGLPLLHAHPCMKFLIHSSPSVHGIECPPCVRCSADSGNTNDVETSLSPRIHCPQSEATRQILSAVKK